ncbi:MAG: flagellar biosynthesis protein FlhB [Desulfotalea sp.]|nr:MAG: flagellar biosynthesis protein FlhB [Desulfotalea sp.]
MDSRKKQKKAVAIIYDDTPSTAPKIIASGKGTIAENIIATAREAGIHIQQDDNLVELLSKVDVGEEIPVDLYQTVAEVLAFVYKVNNRFKDKIEQ